MAIDERERHSSCVSEKEKGGKRKSRKEVFGRLVFASLSEILEGEEEEGREGGR